MGRQDADELFPARLIRMQNVAAKADELFEELETDQTEAEEKYSIDPNNPSTVS